jgi:mono/diheme cytochrome c family protein
MKRIILTAFLALSSLSVMHCSQPDAKAAETQPKASKEALIARGKYLTTIGGCNDCHTPKTMGPEGPEPDPNRLFSGHPADEKVDNAVKTRDWLVMNNGFTAFVGPWGISYAANLSPDDTGIKNWKLEQFITALRKGKSKGIETNRNLLPPMPWQMYRAMSDEDLEAVFVYLQSVPPQNNLVPAPVSREKFENL